MSSEVVPARVTPLSTELFFDASPSRGWGLLGWGVAIFAHVAAAALALSEERRPPPVVPALEVELAPPAPPPPPATVAVTPPAVESRPAERAPALKAAAAPPEPARAGALITAKADPAPTPAQDEPVDFTNDPSLIGFGAGVVAIGGKAQVGAVGARPTSAAPARGSTGVALRSAGEALTPASDLSRKPALGESDPCGGYFPSSATDDVATAAVMVTIGRTGAVSSVQLLSESPANQGFGAAARTCMAGKRFSPGLDRDGNPTATAIRVNIRFRR